MRLIIAKMIKRFILNTKKTAFIVEHDFIISTYVADRVIIFEGKPGVKTVAKKPVNLLLGMNMFLKNLDITFRHDSENFRPRINKHNSQMDQNQKKTGNYFFLNIND